MVDTGKRRRMARLVAEWRRSGESGAGFAKRRGLHPWMFWYWCRKLTAEPAPTTGGPTFVPVQVSAEPLGPVVEIEFQSGDRLRVHAGASADVVRSVVAALRAPC